MTSQIIFIPCRVPNAPSVTPPVVHINSRVSQGRVVICDLKLYVSVSAWSHDSVSERIRLDSHVWPISSADSQRSSADPGSVSWQRGCVFNTPVSSVWYVTRFLVKSVQRNCTQSQHDEMSVCLFFFTENLHFLLFLRISCQLQSQAAVYCGDIQKTQQSLHIKKRLVVEIRNKNSAASSPLLNSSRADPESDSEPIQTADGETSLFIFSFSFTLSSTVFGYKCYNKVKRDVMFKVFVSWSHDSTTGCCLGPVTEGIDGPAPRETLQKLHIITCWVIVTIVTAWEAVSLVTLTVCRLSLRDERPPFCWRSEKLLCVYSDQFLHSDIDQ